MPTMIFVTKKQIADSATSPETILGLSADSREEVDAVVDKALAAGGTAAMDITDDDFMYSRSFLDPDGHHWELLYMDMDPMPPE